MPKITLFDDHKKNLVEIEQVDHETYYGSQQWLISVVQDAFRGSMHVWIAERELKEFVDQLKKCEQSRRREAHLNALSPQEFSSQIFNTRAKGDFALTYEITKSTSDSLVHLRSGFALDPSLLLQILRDFEDFLLPPE